MSFRISARTILHLGSELISNDGVAFYELIKNSLDAGADTIGLNVVERMSFDVLDRTLRDLGERRDSTGWSSQAPAEATRSWQQF
jgi:hypothetical protein